MVLPAATLAKGTKEPAGENPPSYGAPGVGRFGRSGKAEGEPHPERMGELLSNWEFQQGIQ
jgi:hypothetical protein